MILIFNKINGMSNQEAKDFVSGITNQTLTDLYCDCVEFKSRYPHAYSTLSNELDKRKDEQIERGFSE